MRPPNRDPATPGVTVPAPSSRWLRGLILLAGLMIPQWIMYGASLSGNKVLLPLDLLARPNQYLPPTEEYQAHLPVHNPILSDQVLSLEFSRRFCTSEIRKGRLPLWCPNYFLGAPITKWPKYSPFQWIYHAIPSPTTLAWMHVAKCLVAGLGAYWFFRRTLEVEYWPAALGAWCFPLTGFLILWQGYTMSYTVAWLPWLFWAIDSTIHRPGRWGGIGLATTTWLTIITGQVDVGGLVLLASGFYAIWNLLDHGRRCQAIAPVARSATALVLGWALGLMLSAPYLLPMVEYSRTGHRIQQRGSGVEERPPTGLHAIAQTVMPLVYGRNKHDNLYLDTGNRLESAASSYAGFAAALLLAPLAWTNRRQWSRNLGWAVLIVIALSWVLKIPGLISLWRLPGLNMLSFNRLVFAASFAILSLSVVGLDAIWRQFTRPQWWYALPATLVLGLAIWSAQRATHPPEPLATQMESFIQSGNTNSVIQTMDDVRTIQANFSASQWTAAGIATLTLVGWLAVVFVQQKGTVLAVVLGMLLVIEPLILGHDVNPQCDRSLYFPPVPTLQKLAALEPGRVVGYNCLPARLSEANGLRDIRGYDGVDPKRFIEVMNLAMDERTPKVPYALTQMYLPTLQFEGTGTLRMHPVMDLLNVRYVILRGRPVPNIQTVLVGDDYWVVENPRALPRVFVPRQVKLVADDQQRLQHLAAASFNGNQLALVEQPLEVPERSRGTGTIEHETPGQLVVRAQMETTGLLVLADMWDPGWRATRDDQPLTVHRVNHVLRGVVLPAGESIIQFDYQPTSFRWGIGILLAALTVCFAWGVGIWATHARQPGTAE